MFISRQAPLEAASTGHPVIGNMTPNQITGPQSGSQSQHTNPTCSSTDDILVPGYLFPTFTGGENQWMSPAKVAMLTSLESTITGQAGNQDLAENRRRLAEARARKSLLIPGEEDNRFDKLAQARFLTRFPLSQPKDWWHRVPTHASPVYGGVNSRFVELDATSTSMIETLHDRTSIVTVSKLCGSSLGTRRGNKILLNSSSIAGQEQDIMEVGTSLKPSIQRYYQAQTVLVD